MAKRNNILADLLREIAHYLEMENGGFRSRAYERVAQALGDLDEDVSSIYQERGIEGLEEIPRVGENIGLKIEEFIRTGQIAYLNKLRDRDPLELEELIKVEGLGPKRVKALYRELDIANLEDLEEAAKKGEIAQLEGFGNKSQANILEAIEFLKVSKGRSLLGKILPYAEELERVVGEWAEKVSMVGSIRRRRSTIKDVDLLVGADKDVEKIMDNFVSLPNVVKVWSQGETKSSIRLKEGFNVDLRVVPFESYGAAQQYFTGSMEHNIATRSIAKKKGLKLNEYGLFKGEKRVAGETEESVYEALGMDWIPPELREDTGEIEAALKSKLPSLIELGDIKGDLHIHSDWNGGADTIRDMVKKAQSLGYEYIGISDHTKTLIIENGLDEDKIMAQAEEIDEINKELGEKYILHGCEVNIMKDGSLDISDECLSTLDYVIAGVHSHLKEDVTERILSAIRNPHVNIIAHPTGRILKKRDESPLDFNRVLDEAYNNQVALEINSSPKRLDLTIEKIGRTKEAGVKMIINTDAHNQGQMELMRFGVGQARRGWAEKDDIINTWSLDKLIELFNRWEG